MFFQNNEFFPSCFVQDGFLFEFFLKSIGKGKNYSQFYGILVERLPRGGGE